MKPRYLISIACATVLGSICAQAPFTRPVKRAPGTRPPVVIGLGDIHGAMDQLGKTGLPKIDFEAIARSLRISPFLQNDWGRRKKGTGGPMASTLNLSPAELLDVARLALEAVRINSDAQREMARQRRVLAARGIAEVPASTAASRYNLDLGEQGHLVFDFWGEFQIDRRYVKPEDMAVIHKLEAYYRKAFAASSYARQPKPSPRPQVGTAPTAPTPVETVEQEEGEIMEAAASLSPMTRPESNKKRQVPIFRGFEDARYQQHDALIVRLVKDFNAHKAQWIGGTPAQAAKVQNLTPALVKSHMIEETGGNGPMSLAAWPVDPEQVNVPGDWSDVKVDLGLTKPVKRNEGTAEVNVRAAIKFLARKGFGKSGQATRNRPEGFFDGWSVALQRYNARRDRTVDNRYYSDAYSEKIRKRAENPNTFYPIEIRLAAASKTK